MPDITTITPTDGTTYNIKDETARAAIEDCMKSTPVAVADLNSAVAAGFYSFTSSASNRPVDIFTSGGSLLVMRYSDSYLTQFAVANNFTDSSVAMRKYRQGTFSAWQMLVPMIERTYYPAMQVGGISTSTGANTSSTNASGKARSRAVNHIPYKSGATVTAESGYSYIILKYASDGTYDAYTSWLTGTNTVPECGEYRLLVKNDSITDFTGVANDFITVTDYASIQDRFDQVFEEMENMSGLPSAEGVSF